MAKKVPMRLRYLRVKNEIHSTGSSKTCEEELNSLMNCWRVNGVDSVPCLSAVQALAMCSSIAVAAPKANLKPSVNYVLKKMFCKLNGS